MFNPYVQGGTGLSKYKNDYNLIVSAGIGCQVNLTRDVFLLIYSLYRFSVTDKQHNHWVNSIGIAGVINRKKINKAKQIPLPVLSNRHAQPSEV